MVELWKGGGRRVEVIVGELHGRVVVKSVGSSVGMVVVGLMMVNF